MPFLPCLLKIFVTYTLLLIISCTNKLPSEINENNTPEEILELGIEHIQKAIIDERRLLL